MFIRADSLIHEHQFHLAPMRHIPLTRWRRMMPQLAIATPPQGAARATIAAPDLVDQLSELTGFRDRERLDATLVSALRDLLDPQAVAVWAAVGTGGQQRWLKRARLRAGDIAASADAAWIAFDCLDMLDEHPQRMQCLNSRQIQTAVESRTAAPHLCCMTLFPLPSEQGASAVVEVESASPLSAEAVRMVRGILRIYQNFQSLLDYSEHDTLTGLLNRKTFDDSFFKVAIVAPTAPLTAPLQIEKTRRAEQSVKSIYLGVIDIDHFKLVNDNYGHLIGDEVLLLLSRLMRRNFRFSDRLYRFGGEEFLVMMQCGNDAEAMIAFERLRVNTQGYAFPQVGSITISTGFTVVAASDAPSTAFQRADKALYYAKKHGRNQVQSHSVLMAACAIENETRSGDVELF